MNRFRNTLVTLILLICVLAAPIVAQKRPTPPRRPAQPVEPVVTFDTLLSQDIYKIYAEVRNVGQLVRSNGVNDLIEPVMNLTQPPQEFQTVVKWLQANGDALSTSRLMVAGWPNKPTLPSALLAVEFASTDEAKKFELVLRRFMPKLMPKPSPSPAASSGMGTPPALALTREQGETPTPELQYAIKQIGQLVLLTDKPLVLRNLKPKGSPLLSEDPNFVLARNRLSSESVFIFIDIKSIQKEEEEQRKKWEEDEKRFKAAQAANPTPEPAPEISELTAVLPGDQKTLEQPLPSDTPDPDVMVADEIDPTAPNVIGPSPADVAMSSIFSMIFAGQAKFPEALGIAIDFEQEGYVARVLVLDGPDNKSTAIPFVPQFVSGPAITPGAATVMPADLDIFATFSVDYPQVYEGMLKAISRSMDIGRQIGPAAGATSPPVSPFAEVEKLLGLKIKDDILPLLGNELAVGFPKKQPQPSPSPSPSLDPITGEPAPEVVTRAPDITPIFVVGLRDKEAVKRLLPQIVDKLAFKGANMFAQNERRGDAEIITYANMFSYAFIGDYLVFTPDTATTRHVADAYLSNQTLSSDPHYRNSTRWQPRQVQGQVYAGPGLIDMMNPLAVGGPMDERLRDVMSRLNPVIDPLSYALFNDGSGPMHELHLPKNLLMMFIFGVTSQGQQSSLVTNESIAQSVLRMIASGEATYRSKHNRYGSLDELVQEGLASKDLIEKYGYKVELTVLSNKFEVTATPLEYGKSGKRSFFVDETNVLRAGDHGGGAATIADKPLE